MTRLAAAVLSLAGCLAGASAAQATVFRPSEHIGTYAVVGGMLKQHATFAAKASDVLLSTDGCWEQVDDDHGSTDVDLVATKGHRIEFLRTGGVVHTTTILFDGTARSTFSRSETYVAGPGADGRDNCPGPPAPRTPPDTSRCGTRTVTRDTAIGLGSFAAAFGRIGVGLEPLFSRNADPFGTRCPSEVSWGSLVLTSPSVHRADFTRDRTVRLEGKATDTSPDAISWPGESDRVGRQRSTISWVLVLRRIGPAYKKE